MKMEQITNQTIEKFLKAVCSGTHLDSPLTDLEILDQFPNKDQVGRGILLFERLSAITAAAYCKYRKDELLSDLLPCFKPDAQKQIAEDFSRGNEKLESFSALYYRYFSQINFSVEDLASTANVVPQQFRRRLNSGLSALVHELRKLEMAANQKAHNPGEYLPLPTYLNLIGIDQLLSQLDSLLNSLNPGQILSIEGMGGIGKTTLTLAYVNQESVICKYNQVLWVSARPQPEGYSNSFGDSDEINFTLEDVTSRLAEQLGLGHLADKGLDERLKGIQAATTLQDYLLIIDNLETISDYAKLIPAVARYCGRCKVIITTRESLKEFPYVTVFQVPELSRVFASQLAQAEVARRGKTPCLSSEDLDNLYKTVGGLPLAIKLIAAQLHLLTIDEIVNEFKNADHRAEALYRFLYWKIWNSLDEYSRQLLFTFLTTDPEGEDIKFLSQLSGLSPECFIRSFQTLETFSLIETNRMFSELKYRIHRLTVTFLQTDVLKNWASKTDGT